MARITDPMTRTADEWREEAARCRRASADSFARSDTDGFLSQWASDKMAQRYDQLAQIVDDGGFWFLGLTDLQGNLLNARYVETRYGWSWVYDDEAGNAVWFRESNARSGERRRAAHEKKGYRLVQVKQAAVMFDDGNLAPKRDSEVLDVREVGYEDY